MIFIKQIIGTNEKATLSMPSRLCSLNLLKECQQNQADIASIFHKKKIAININAQRCLTQI